MYSLSCAKENANSWIVDAPAKPKVNPSIWIVLASELSNDLWNWLNSANVLFHLPFSVPKVKTGKLILTFSDLLFDKKVFKLFQLQADLYLNSVEINSSFTSVNNFL